VDSYVAIATETGTANSFTTDKYLKNHHSKLVVPHANLYEPSASPPNEDFKTLIKKLVRIDDIIFKIIMTK